MQKTSEVNSVLHNSEPLSPLPTSSNVVIAPNPSLTDNLPSQSSNSILLQTLQVPISTPPSTIKTISAAHIGNFGNQYQVKKFFRI